MRDGICKYFWVWVLTDTLVQAGIAVEGPVINSICTYREEMISTDITFSYVYVSLIRFS